MYEASLKDYNLFWIFCHFLWIILFFFLTLLTYFLFYSVYFLEISKKSWKQEYIGVFWNAKKILKQ